MSNVGVYYFPYGDQIIIAWELYQKNSVTALDVGLQGYTYGLVEVYHLCAIAVEGPNGVLMFNKDQFEKNFVFLGEFE